MRNVRQAAATDIAVRAMSEPEFLVHVSPLSELLVDTVHDDIALGFLPPVDPDEARCYWLSLLPSIREGTRVVVGAFSNGRIIGSGQLAISIWPNAHHRAEIHKVFVDSAFRGRGVGRALMLGLHEVARSRGRSLILLNARPDPAQLFYASLGYREVGLIPGYTLSPTGERVDSVSMYLDFG